MGSAQYTYFPSLDGQTVCRFA